LVTCLEEDILEWYWQTAVIVGMFVIRLGIPLVITLAVAYWLRRLDAKWQAEAMLQWQASQATQENPEAGLTLYRRLEEPCWVTTGCNEDIRVNCPAYKRPTVPCWMARRGADGQLPVECYTCERLLYGPVGQPLKV
jgi:hypothetical protein